MHWSIFTWTKFDAKNQPLFTKLVNIDSQILLSFEWFKCTAAATIEYPRLSLDEKNVMVDNQKNRNSFSWIYTALSKFLKTTIFFKIFFRENLLHTSASLKHVRKFSPKKKRLNLSSVNFRASRLKADALTWPDTCLRALITLKPLSLSTLWPGDAIWRKIFANIGSDNQNQCFHKSQN